MRHKKYLTQSYLILHFVRALHYPYNFKEQEKSQEIFCKSWSDGRGLWAVGRHQLSWNPKAHRVYKARYMTIFWASLLKPTPSHYTSPISVLILPSHSRLRLLNGFFPWGLCTFSCFHGVREASKQHNRENLSVEWERALTGTEHIHSNFIVLNIL
jgi:hypothetical protein